MNFLSSYKILVHHPILFRCEDVQDLGTNFDTHLCEECGGHALPVSLDLGADWQCLACQKVGH